MSRPRIRRALAASAFAAAAVCYGLGLAGRAGPWLAMLLATLALLTVGFFVAGGAARATDEASGR